MQNTDDADHGREPSTQLHDFRSVVMSCSVDDRLLDKITRVLAAYQPLWVTPTVVPPCTADSTCESGPRHNGRRGPPHTMMTPCWKVSSNTSANHRTSNKGSRQGSSHCWHATPPSSSKAGGSSRSRPSFTSVSRYMGLLNKLNCANYTKVSVQLAQAIETEVASFPAATSTNVMLTRLLDKACGERTYVDVYVRFVRDLCIRDDDTGACVRGFLETYLCAFLRRLRAGLVGDDIVSDRSNLLANYDVFCADVRKRSWLIGYNALVVRFLAKRDRPTLDDYFSELAAGIECVDHDSTVLHLLLECLMDALSVLKSSSAKTAPDGLCVVLTKIRALEVSRLDARCRFRLHDAISAITDHCAQNPAVSCRRLPP